MRVGARVARQLGERGDDAHVRAVGVGEHDARGAGQHWAARVAAPRAATCFAAQRHRQGGLLAAHQGHALPGGSNR